MLENIDHVIVLVSDLEEATERYTALLGRAPSWRGRHPGQGTANTLFRLANTYVELLCPRGEGGFAGGLRARLEADGEGIAGIAFGTHDIEAACRAVREAGRSIADPIAAEGSDERTGAVRRWKMALLPTPETRGILAFLIEHDEDSDPLEPAPFEAAREDCVAGLDHVVLRTSDPEAAIALYGDALGIRLALDKCFEQRGVRLQFFRLGGATFEVASSISPGDDGESSTDRLWGLAYQVPSVRGARDRLAKVAIDVSEVRTGHKPGTSVCTVLEGTHGVPTLLIGPD